MMIRTRELMMLIIFLIAGDDWSKPGLDVVDGLDEKLHQLKPIKSSSHSATDHRGAGGGDWSKPGLGVVDGLQPITNSSHSVTKTTGEFITPERKAKGSKKERGKRKMNKRSRKKCKRHHRVDVCDIKLKRNGWPKDNINAVFGCRVRLRKCINNSLFPDTWNRIKSDKPKRPMYEKRNVSLDDTGLYGDVYLNVSEFRWKNDTIQFIKVRLGGTVVMEWEFETPSVDMKVYVHRENRTNKKKIYIAEVDKNCGNMHINLTRSGETQKVTFTIDNTTIEDLNFNYGITVQFSGTCIMVSPLIKLIEDFDFVWLPSSDTVNIEFEQSVELFWSYKTQRSPTRIILKRKSDIKKERVGIWTLANGFQTELNISTIFSKTVIYNSNITDGFIYETVGLKLSEVNLEDIRVVYYCRVIYGMEYRYTKYVTLIHAESTTINVYDEVIPEKKSLIILLVSMESAICILLVVFLIVTIILFFCIKYTGCKSKKQACQNQMIPSAYSKYHVTIEKESVPFCKKLCWLGHYKMTQDEYHNYDEELL
ncbi:uncharacterized protein LOC126826167 isoform X2 [Patella vulgata]|uniref:uncharacterized protein LOC126826167 isoform X2 n=1 Tax=Patella vulgata TaxID=6465 RepID=UPI00217FD933|nr:uncharacterized protein LOC126826167 isoform X2 [Patella vulgata]